MKVLLAVDGSEGSRAAERVLAQFPFETPPVVKLIHVVPVPSLEALTSGVTDQVAQLVEQNHEQGRVLIDEAVERCRAWAEHLEFVLRDGHVAREILQEAEEWKADVIAVGARGLGGFARALLGSVSDRLVKHAPCSVLVVHKADEHYKLHRILIADDESPGSQAAVRRFAALPLGAVRTVCLLRVVPRRLLEMIHAPDVPPQPVLTEPTAVEHEAVLRRMQVVARQFDGSHAQVHTRVEDSVEVAMTILDTASAEQSDLIVVGSQGHSAWDRFLIGSVSLRTLHHADRPVWLERTPR